MQATSTPEKNLAQTEKPLSLNEIAAQIPDGEKIGRMKEAVESMTAGASPLLKPLLPQLLNSLYRQLDEEPKKINDFLERGYEILDFILLGETGED